MVIFWLASVLFVILLAILFRTERMALEEGRARRRALVMDGIRLAIVALMFLALPLAEPRPVATIGLGLAALGFVAVPTRWIIALGGVDPKWDLRPVQARAAVLMGQYRSPMPPDGADRMRLLLHELAGLRSADTAELCDLLAARYGDWIAGTSEPLAQARRSIRIYDLQRELYGDDVKPPQLDEGEATFRWRLYRAIGTLTELGAAQATPEQRARFGEIVRELGAYRRDDTTELIDCLAESGRSWLRSRSARPWRMAAGAAEPEPLVEQARLRLWPGTSVFWGAILDESDRRELAPLRENR
jgi:hypothetical protein